MLRLMMSFRTSGGTGQGVWHEMEGLKRVLRAMMGLEEMSVVCNVTTVDWTRVNSFLEPKVQITVFEKLEKGQEEEGWPIGVEELPDVRLGSIRSGR